MEHAGSAVAQEAQRLLHQRKGRGKVLVLSGAGANGGDGFVTARHLDNWGIPVEVVLVGDPERVQGAARTNLEILRRLKVRFSVVRSLQNWSRWVSKHPPARLVVDALLGTGMSGLVRDPIRSVIEWLNQSRCPVIAVDLPSGLCADTGSACGVAVRASYTVTFGFPKRGLLTRQGRRYAGRLRVADISIPRALRR